MHILKATAWICIHGWGGGLDSVEFIGQPQVYSRFGYRHGCMNNPIHVHVPGQFDLYLPSLYCCIRIFVVVLMAKVLLALYVHEMIHVCMHAYSTGMPIPRCLCVYTYRWCSQASDSRLWDQLYQRPYIRETMHSALNL